MKEIIAEKAELEERAKELHAFIKEQKKFSRQRAIKLLGEAALKPEHRRHLEALRASMSPEDAAVVADAAFAASE